MNIIEIIEKKKAAKELTKEEIEFFIKGYTNDEITDYQAAALVMAICINGMTKDEILNLTISMANSGDVLEFSNIEGKIIDKHSTGGIGDKVTLVAMPIVASLGIPVAKMSGRGLGITGGTVDKLESIPGYNVSLSVDEFKNNVKEIGISLIGQTMNLAPADKKIYALRDAIGCTNSMPLIASSIMSKKIAAGVDAIVLEVTCGNGAFMPNKTKAEELARMMKLIGKWAQKQTKCIITAMDEPLGKSVGNVLEIKEVAEALKGKIQADVYDVVLEVCKQIMLLSGKYSDEAKCEKLVKEQLKNGKAFEKFKELVAKQGGDISYIDDLEKFAKAKYITPIISKEKGYVQGVNAGIVGKAALELGVGRHKKEDSIDPTVGFIFEKKTGDKVKVGDVLAYVHGNDLEKVNQAIETVLGAYTIGNKKIEVKNVIKVI